MSSRHPRTRPVLAAGTAVLLALAATGCGSSDDESTGTTTAAGGDATTTTATTAEGGDGGSGGTPTGGAPAADEGAIRAALARGPESTKAAKTARITLETSTAGITTKATGTLDLAEQRYLFTQTLGGGASGSGGSGAAFQNYGEKGKVYIRIPGPGGWSVTDNPIEQSDPLAQVRQLEKAKITDIGDTREVDGKTCREFSAELSLADVLGQIDDPTFKKLLADSPSGAKVPVTTCIDDGGLAYSSTSEYDIKDVLGGATAKALPDGRSSSKLTISDYGTAPEPKRPAGIDDAKPLGTGIASPSAG